MRKKRLLSNDLKSSNCVLLTNSELEFYKGGAKGDADSPYTFEEFNSFSTKDWKGGWVEGLGYVSTYTEISPSNGSSSLASSGSIGYSDSWSSESGSDYSGSNGSDSNSSNNDIYVDGGGGSGYGTSRTDNTPYSDGEINNLSRDNFKGYLASYPDGCLDRCKEMLVKTNAVLSTSSDRAIMMTNNKADGTVDSASVSSQIGIDYLNSEILKGHGVIVGVDYKGGHSSNGVGDTAADHYVIIVGRDTNHVNGHSYYRYYFFDPATSNKDYGTSRNNFFYVKDGLLKGTFTHMTKKGLRTDSYTVTNMRNNK